MAKRLIVILAVLALGVAFAGVVPAVAYKITLAQPSVFNGTDLKAGEYRVTLGDSQVTLVQGKQKFVVAAKIQHGDTKFETTSIRSQSVGTKLVISEIRLGGSKTTITAP